MIPYSYHMVDMGGIDLAEANHTVVEGVFSKIEDALDDTRVLVLYNMYFAKIRIPPSYCNIDVEGGSIYINDSIEVSANDEITVIGVPPPLEPVIPLSVDDNGVYSIEPPQSGYNPVTVALQFTELFVTENGEYTPQSPYRGFSRVTTDIQTGPLIISEAMWESLTLSQKRALGLVVIQTNESGFELGDYVNAALYVPEPELIASYSMNAQSTTPIEHTFTSGKFMILIANCSAGQFSNLGITLNETDISSSFVQRVSNANPILTINSIQREFSSGDVLTVSNVGKVPNGGVQVFIIKEGVESSISLVGIAPNDNTSFTIPQSAGYSCIESAKFGYYGSRNTVPEVSLFSMDSAVQSTPCPNNSTYWYGGTFAIKFLKGE